MSQPQSYPDIWMPAPAEDWTVHVREAFWGHPTPFNRQTEVFELAGDGPLPDDEEMEAVNVENLDDQFGLAKDNAENPEIFWHTGISHLCVNTGGKLLVRAEYMRAYNKIGAMCQKYDSTGVVFTGQPGIGKTTGLFVFLILHLAAKEATIVHHEGETRYFHPSGVFILIDCSANAVELTIPRKAWALIDSDEAVGPPPVYLVSVASPVFPVHAAPPRLERYRAWAKQREAWTVIVNPFTWSEIVACATLQTKLKDKENLKRQLRGAYIKYGPSARSIYTQVTSGQAEESLKYALSALETNTSVLRRAYPREGSIEVASHSSEERDTATISITSNYIFKRIIYVVGEERLERLREFSRELQGDARAATLRGHLWEAYCHRKLSRIGEHKIVKMDPIGSRRLRTSTILTLSDKTAMPYKKSLSSNETSDHKKYWVLSERNDATFHSFVHNPPCGFHTTLATTHGLNVDELEILKQRLGDTGRMRPRFITVVPKGQVFSFENFPHAWVDKFDYYILELEDLVQL